VSGCWSEGELRAALDREMPARDLECVMAHIGECAGCGAIYRELEGRASRVGALLDSLPETAAVKLPARVPHRGRQPVWWASAAAGLAASLTLALILAPRRIPPPRSPAPPRFVEPAVKPVASLPRIEHPVASPRVPTRRAPVPAPPPAPARVEDFVALDDQPIEAGVVVRVELDNAANGARIPADVIIGIDGRPRAIRFVSASSGEL
jgi:hypothetical protein